MTEQKPERGTEGFNNIFSWTTVKPGEAKDFFTHPVSGKRLKLVQQAWRRFCPDQPLSECWAHLDYESKAKRAYWPGVFGRFLLVDSTGKKRVLHAKQFINADTLKITAQIYDHARQFGVASPALQRMPDDKVFLPYNDITKVFMTSYIDGRHPFTGEPSDSKKDMKAMANTLARFEKAMESLPQEIVDHVKANTEADRKRQRDGYAYACSEEGRRYMTQKVEGLPQAVPGVENEALLFWSMENYMVALSDQNSNAVTHSDLVQGNILVQPNGLLDYDNLAAGFFPRSVDIGMAAHRAGIEMLGTGASPAQIRSHLNAFVSGYNEAGQNATPLTLPKLCQAMILAANLKITRVTGEYAKGEGRSPEVSNGKVGKFTQLNHDLCAQLASILPQGTFARCVQTARPLNG